MLVSVCWCKCKAGWLFRDCRALTAHLDDWRRRVVTVLRQFGAVLRKNVLLQTRGRRALFGLSGGVALALELLTPAAFFLLMCLPKFYLPAPQSTPLSLFVAHDLDDASWARVYTGLLH